MVLGEVEISTLSGICNYASHLGLVLSSRRKNWTIERNGEVLSFKLVGPMSECTKEKTHLRNIHFLEIMRN